MGGATADVRLMLSGTKVINHNEFTCQQSFPSRRQGALWQPPFIHTTTERNMLMQAKLWTRVRYVRCANESVFDMEHQK